MASEDECVADENCRKLMAVLEGCDPDSARLLLWRAAHALGWDPYELLGLDVDEMTGSG